MEKLQGKTCIEHSLNIPQMRFPEFKGEWEKKKLGDLTETISSGKSKSRETRGVYPFYGSTGIIGYSNSFDYSGKKILIARVGANAGSLYKVDGNYSVTDNTLMLDLNDGIDIDFIHSYLIKKDLNKLVFGSGQPLITGGHLKMFEILLPKLIEQQKIASFLTSVDEKITQLKQKKTLLEQYKKGVMQKIFSQELRFKDENGKEFSKWENQNLGDLSIYISDGNYGELYPKASEMKDAGVPFIRANNIKNLSLIWDEMKFIEIEHHKILKSGHLLENDILVTTRGDIGMVAFVTKEFEGANINAQICLLRTDNNLNAKFLLQYLGSDFGLKQFKRLQTGSALKQLPKGNLVKIRVPYPALPEQTKIANFLTAIDEKINHCQAQIEKTEQWKKGLLQQMFV